MNTGSAAILWLNGPDGVGKSTVGFAIFRKLSDSGRRSAFVDVDQVGLCYPAPDDDPVNDRMKAAGLAAVLRTYVEEGVHRVVVSGIAETNEAAQMYRTALPTKAVTMVRLRVAPDELLRRFVGRGWQAERVDEVKQLAEAMDRDDVGDLCVDIDGLTSDEAAKLVRASVGPPWLE